VIRRLRLASIDLVPGCTQAVGVGQDAQGNEVTFTVDWRPALALADALKAGERVEVTLADQRVVCWSSVL
jgi:hypothetical protein